MTTEIKVGCDYPTNTNGMVHVVKIENSLNILVRFHNTKFEKVVTANNLRKGRVKDDSLFFHGSGAINDLRSLRGDAKPVREYSLWNSMIQRCYSIKRQEKKPAYKDCFVSEHFKLFSNFVAWCNKQVGFGVAGFHLDKDLLIKGNKEYSPETCVFLPSEVNIALEKCDKVRGSLPVGVHFDKRCGGCYRANVSRNSVTKNLGGYNTPEEAFFAYKTVKEAYLKDLANKWKEQIDPRAYNALMNYEVSIDD